MVRFISLSSLCRTRGLRWACLYTPSDLVEADNCNAALLRRREDALEPFCLHVDALRLGTYPVRRKHERLLAPGAATNAGEDILYVGVV